MEGNMPNKYRLVNARLNSGTDTGPTFNCTDLGLECAPRAHVRMEVVNELDGSIITLFGRRNGKTPGQVYFPIREGVTFELPQPGHWKAYLVAAPVVDEPDSSDVLLTSDLYERISETTGVPRRIVKKVLTAVAVS